ncbi:MAG: SDR family oxidoreductase [Acidobacteriota bacterium]
MDEFQIPRTALITGASAGIGAAFAHVFAEHGFDLVLTARRGDRLTELAKTLATQHGRRVHIVAADLADPTAPARIEREITAAGITIDALINNAGYGLPGNFLDCTWDQHRDFLQVMVTAVADLTRRFLPGMIARRYGRIINVASLAGLVPVSAGHTMYGASKSMVIKFSQSLALETMASDVHVTALCPGFTYSEFHDVNGMRTQVSQLPAFMWMDAETVARQGYDAVMRGDMVCVNGRVNRCIAFITRVMPQWFIMLVVKRVARTFRRT